MTNSTYNAHTMPLFIHHAILPFDKLIIQSQLNFMHAIEYKYAPPSFDDTWQKIVIVTLLSTYVMPTITISPDLGLRPSKNLRFMPYQRHGMTSFQN
jgi:hypothetical protein